MEYLPISDEHQILEHPTKYRPMREKVHKPKNLNSKILKKCQGSDAKIGKASGFQKKMLCLICSAACIGFLTYLVKQSKVSTRSRAIKKR